MVLHIHYVVAKNTKGFKRERESLLNQINDLIRAHNVTILMMDANMALFLVIDSLRSRGVHVDVTAWYPWVTIDGHNGCDSCCLALINQPGDHKLKTSYGDLQRGDRAWGGDVQRIDSWVQDNQLKDHAGCGQLLRSYIIPQGENDVLQGFLRPSIAPGTEEMDNYVRSCGQFRDRWTRSLPNADYKKEYLCTREMRLKDFHFQGRTINGTHYPLVTMMKMSCTRSEEAIMRRRQKQKQKDGAVVTETRNLFEEIYGGAVGGGAAKAAVAETSGGGTAGAAVAAPKGKGKGRGRRQPPKGPSVDEENRFLETAGYCQPQGYHAPRQATWIPPTTDGWGERPRPMHVKGGYYRRPGEAGGSNDWTDDTYQFPSPNITVDENFTPAHFEAAQWWDQRGWHQ